MAHQYTALAYLRENRGGALFMQMRLGKTLVCIRYAQERKYEHILVVAPIEGIWAWKRELEMEKETYEVLHGMKPGQVKGVIGMGFVRYYLVNYESLVARPFILDWNWNCIIVDESRRLANPKGKMAKLLVNRPKNEVRIILSGEPAPETPMEYFQQYKFLYGSFMGCSNFWAFRNKVFQELAPHEFVVRPHYLAKLKEEIRTGGFFLSRKEAGIPDKKIYETRTVQLPTEYRKMYNEVLKDFVASLDGKELKTTKWVPVQYLWLHQIASGWLGEKALGGWKEDEVLRLLGGELKKEQVVVWFRFNPALNSIYRRLTLSGYPCAKITGEESREQREKAIDEFRNGNLSALLVQVKCGKTAIDLSCSSTAIYFTNSYSLEERKQSEDRILNPKKREPLLYLDLVTEQTVEEDILEALRQKSSDAKYYVSRLISSLRKETTV